MNFNLQTDFNDESNTTNIDNKKFCMKEIKNLSAFNNIHFLKKSYYCKSKLIKFLVIFTSNQHNIYVDDFTITDA